MRIDGRNNNELRQIKIYTDYILNANGSALIEMGNTRVICTAAIDDKVPAFLKGTGKGWITSEYGMLPDLHGYGKPESSRGRPEDGLWNPAAYRPLLRCVTDTDLLVKEPYGLIVTLFRLMEVQDLFDNRWLYRIGAVHKKYAGPGTYWRAHQKPCRSSKCRYSE